ncbi:hypothetical protein D3C86_1468240 [compost metagenome]
MFVERWQQRMVGARQLAGPPDQRHGGEDGQGDQPLHQAGGARRALAEGQHGGEGEQLDGEDLAATERPQRLPEAGGDLQRRRQADRQHGEKHEGHQPLQPRTEGAADQVRRAAGVREVSAQLGEGEGHRQHQHDEQQPGPQRGRPGRRGGQRRHGEDAGAEQRGAEQGDALQQAQLLVETTHGVCSHALGEAPS